MNPTRADKYYWSLLTSEIGCIACHLDGIKNDYCSIHHISGRSTKGSHSNVLPLCGMHHQTGGQSAPSIHPWKARFIEKYGTQEALKKICDGILLDNGVLK